VTVLSGDVTDPSSLSFPNAKAIVFACSAATYSGPKTVDLGGLVNVINIAKERPKLPHIVLVTSRLVNPVNGW